MLSVTSIPAFTDNYIWLLNNDDNQCIVVDPGDATPVINHLKNRSFELVGVLITHHHADHTGGIDTLTRQWPGIPVYGPENESIAGVTHKLHEASSFELLGATFNVLDVPGHTRGHIAYLTGGKVFCGDTLFSAGCGRLFEGTPKQMLQSLQKLKSLPDETEVYCTHEYTAANLRFATTVDASNSTLLSYEKSVRELRKKGLITLPSSIGVEKAINPFLRCDNDDVINAVSHRKDVSNELETFTELRRWKDEF
ncbi:hydroxyacylglutathione hydrolase [Veronia nyctiphanis]|uniref:Hydroxyacylglutathione hydrolase n=1 Tax=Veronia nyctiphanis TaxID=1278244 RepID=A0A4Q0YM54_9GAMM|nr:hydroxyacylglutathione hydrolase [Veronia nyctiphanis]RXJ71465.1 hydroxyacylglutathione hydrolase [Veronia nyctiphanis]